jgi:hypothetical protein
MTLAEIMIAMVVGLLIMTSAMSFTITTFRVVEHTNLREDVFRTGRFIGAVAGARCRRARASRSGSQVRFGTCWPRATPMVIVSVPFDTLPVPLRNPAVPGIAPVYSMPAGTATPATPGLRQLRHLLRRRHGWTASRTRCSSASAT